MSSAVLYCRTGCGACDGVARQLADGGVGVEVRDVGAEAGALDAVMRLGYSSLPVLVGPDGSSAAGAEATVLAQQLTGATGAAAAGPGHHHETNAEESQ